MRFAFLAFVPLTLLVIVLLTACVPFTEAPPPYSCTDLEEFGCADTTSNASNQ